MNMIKLVVVIQVATVVATSCHNHSKGAFIPAGPEEDYNIITIARSPYDMHEFVIGIQGALEHWPGCVFCDEQKEPYVAERIYYIRDLGTTNKTILDTVYFKTKDYE